MPAYPVRFCFSRWVEGTERLMGSEVAFVTIHLAEKYIIEQPHKTNTMSSRKDLWDKETKQVADAGQARFGKCVLSKEAITI